jgi:hypothetical protein
MRRYGFALALIALASAGCGGAGDKHPTASGGNAREAPSAAARSTSSAPRPAAITSTLDGLRVVPHRYRWIADSHVRASISEVRFVIDGSVRWIEHDPPYMYGGDDAGANRGFLITTWLAPGPHRFTVMADDDNGRTYSRTVTARVLPAPKPPPALAGRWRRSAPEGHWDLIFDRIGEWHLDPEGSGLANQMDISGHTLHVYAPIQMSPLINDHTQIKRLGHVDLGGFDCNPAGPFGTYRWTISGDRLTLRPLHERCPDRNGILAHTWRRVGPVAAWRAPNL